MGSGNICFKVDRVPQKNCSGGYMGRVERFRQLRLIRQRYFYSIMVFVIILTLGICAADYSVNNLLGGRKGLGFISLDNYGTYIEVGFMNQKVKIDTEYVNKDLDRIKQQAARLFGKGT